jgi:hypothetical protein
MAYLNTGILLIGRRDPTVDMCATMRDRTHELLAQPSFCKRLSVAEIAKMSKMVGRQPEHDPTPIKYK